MKNCNTFLMRTSLSLFSLASLFLACGKPPLSPSKLSVSAVDSTAVELTWESSTDNISGFKIGQERDSGGFDTVATIPSNPLTYRISNLKPATRYRFLVWAYNGKGISLAAGPVACTTTPSGTRVPDSTPPTKREKLEDDHIGWTGTRSHDNEYHFTIVDSGKSYVLKICALIGRNTSNGSCTSNGQIKFRISNKQASNETDWNESSFSCLTIPYDLNVRIGQDAMAWSRNQTPDSLEWDVTGIIRGYGPGDYVAVAEYKGGDCGILITGMRLKQNH